MASKLNNEMVINFLHQAAEVFETVNEKMERSAKLEDYIGTLEAKVAALTAEEASLNKEVVDLTKRLAAARKEEKTYLPANPLTAEEWQTVQEIAAILSWRGTNGAPHHNKWNYLTTKSRFGEINAEILPLINKLADVWRIEPHQGK